MDYLLIKIDTQSKISVYDPTSGPNAYTNDVVCDDWEDALSAMGNK